FCAAASAFFAYSSVVGPRSAANAPHSAAVLLSKAALEIAELNRDDDSSNEMGPGASASATLLAPAASLRSAAAAATRPSSQIRRDGREIARNGTAEVICFMVNLLDNGVTRNRCSHTGRRVPA